VKFILEVKYGDSWRLIGSQTETDPPGSISSTSPSGEREVYMFGWWDGAPGVWRSSGGADVETSEIRFLMVEGELEQLSDLTEPWERDRWFLDGSNHRVRVRREA
jgi:hypothetical protein